MIFRYFLFIILTFAGLTSKSQTLLNLNLSQVSKILSNASLSYKSIKEAKFRYEVPPEGNDCIFFTTCYFDSDKKCFKYVNDYWGNTLAYQEINRLKKCYPNLKQVAKSQWLENKKQFRITLINDKKTRASYSLKIEKINN